MGKTAQKRGKTLAEDQGNFFLSLTKKMGWKIAPSREELDAVAQRLKWRLKRKKGMSPGKELARRKRARGTFARGWQILKVESLKSRIRIWIGNMVSYAGKVDSERNVSKQAANVVGGRFKSRLDRLAQQATGDF